MLPAPCIAQQAAAGGAAEGLLPYPAPILARRGLSVRVEVVDERHAVVKDGPGSQRHLPIRRSPSAEAAASVALSQSSVRLHSGELRWPA